MAKKTALDRAEERINQLQRDRSEEIQNLERAIAAAEANITAAKSRMEQAEACGDPAAYREAKRAEFDSTTDLEFSRKRKARLQTAPLVSEEEGRSAVAEILAEEDAADATDRAAVKEHIAALEKLATAAKRRKERANSVLETWQGVGFKTDRKDMINTWEVPTLVEKTINDNRYRVINGEPIGTAYRTL